MKKPIFTGVCTALITPFTISGKIDFDAMAKIIEFNIDGGVDALLVLGTTGETPTLTEDEKKSLTQFTINRVAGRVPVVVGIGGNNAAACVKSGNFAKKCGADGLLLSSPYYNKATQAGMVQFFKFVCKNVGLPLIAYNVPGRTGINIEPQTLEQIASIRQVVGIKEASGNMAQISKVCALCGEKVAVYSGDDALTLPILAVGGKGVISVASNVVPHLVKKQYILYQKESYNLLQKFSANLLGFYNALFCEVNPIPVKYLASTLGLCKNVLRMPLTTLTEKNCKMLQNTFNLIAK